MSYNISAFERKRRELGSCPDNTFRDPQGNQRIPNSTQVEANLEKLRAFPLARSRAKYTLTRTFAIIPEHIKGDNLDKYLQYSQISKIFNKFNAYKNLYTQWLIQFYLNDEKKNIDYFEFKGVENAGTIWNAFNLTSLKAPAYYKSKYSFKLLQRLRTSAYFSAYISIRNWIIRKEHIINIIDVLINKLSNHNDQDFCIQFLSGKKFRYAELKEFFVRIHLNCFGEESIMTVNHLNNMLGQVRNIFFNHFDLISQDNQPFSKTIKALENPSLQLISKIATSFTKKEDKKPVFIDEDELCYHTLGLFFRKISKITTSLYKTKNFSKIKEFLGNIDISNFEKKRESLFKQLKSNYSSQITVDNIYEIITNVWNEFIENFLEDSDHKIIKRIFSPHHSRNFSQDVSFNSFLEFFENKVYYKIRELFRYFFVDYDFSNHLFGYVDDQLRLIFYNVNKFLTITIHRCFSMSLNREALWTFRKKTNVHKFHFPKVNSDNFFKLLDVNDISEGKLLFRANFIPNKSTDFRVFDKNHRLINLIKDDFTFHNPTLTFKNRKILLHLPFQKEKGHESTQSANVSDDIQIGVDLGLIHFVILCVKKNGKIIKIYFLGAKELFNKKFDKNTGNLIYQNKCYDDCGNFLPHNLTNIKLKLINLRKEIKKIQKLKNEYEDRLKKRGIPNFRSKLNWNKLKRTLSTLWQKVNKINSQIAKYTGNFIYEIAKHHKVNIIKFEDLSWVTHSKKKDCGKFLAKWQVHWIFSQMQIATSDRCRSLGIKVGVVDAKNTSKECSNCGAIGNRDGKQFSCKVCDINYDSDLNACYNVVNRSIKKYI